MKTITLIYKGVEHGVFYNKKIVYAVISFLMAVTGDNNESHYIIDDV